MQILVWYEPIAKHCENDLKYMYIKYIVMLHDLPKLKVFFCLDISSVCVMCQNIEENIK